MADECGLQRMIDRLNDRFRALEIEHTELKTDVKHRVERMENRLEQVADSHQAQTEKLDQLLEMGRSRDQQVTEINTAVQHMAPHVKVIKDAMVVWRFFRLPAIAVVGGVVTAAIGYFNPPTWIKAIFK